MKIMGVDFKAGDEETERQARAALRARWTGGAYIETIRIVGPFKSIEWTEVANG